jgi:hypothetical protein
MHLLFQLQYHELRGAPFPEYFHLENDRANRAVDSAGEWLDLILGDYATTEIIQGNRTPYNWPILAGFMTLNKGFPLMLSSEK